MRWLGHAIGVLALVGVGCAEGLPDRQKIAEVRALAARTSVTLPLVAEAPGEAPRAQALPGETVVIDPFVVGPDGVLDPAGIDPVWIACPLAPGQGPFACLQQALPLSLDTLPDCSDGASACLVSRGEATPEFAVDPTFAPGWDVEFTLIGADPAGTDVDRCARELLRGDVDLPDDCIYGVDVLRVGTPAEPDDDFDRHPSIVSFVVSNADGSHREVEPGEVISVPLGETLEIETTSPADDLQWFSIPGPGGSRAQEAYEGDWFVTWGELLSGVSLDPTSRNTWTLEAASDDDLAVPRGGRAHLYYVVRDGRGGVAWWWFTVAVEP